MILIIGGAYQGKRTYAMNRFGLTDSEVFTCSDDELVFTSRCIDRLEEYVWNCVEKGTDPLASFQEHFDEWHDSILICQDIFCGVVPVDAKHRKWRQETGKLCQYLSGEATEVIRIFCGLEQRLK